MTHTSDTSTYSHTYTCALPTGGAVCDCHPRHNPSASARPQMSGEQYENRARNRPPASLFRPGGRDRMFKRSLPSDLLQEEQQPGLRP
jgi:hypothetical protein